MMSFFKKLFGAKTEPIKPEKVSGKYDDFSVEHYPETGVYYAKYKTKYMYKSKYMKTVYNTGIVELMPSDWTGIAYGQQFRNEKDAWKVIDLFIEQRFKENVKTITR